MEVLESHIQAVHIELLTDETIVVSALSWKNTQHDQ